MMMMMMMMMTATFDFPTTDSKQKQRKKKDIFSMDVFFDGPSKGDHMTTLVCDVRLFGLEMW